MKLRSLHINQFGHFADFDLPLASDGFQVLLGRNEAGKTTLLEFLRSVLFGFLERTLYAFAGSTELGGVASLTLADGREVELRRRKGRKNTVSVQINGQDTTLDETGFSHLLGHANRNLFSSVFAFGLSELSSGEESLKHESLQSALFGGGLGGAFSPEKILATLQSSADELFKEGGKVPAINKLCGELKEISRQIKEKSIRTDEFVSREQALREAEQAAQQLRDEVQTLRQRHSHTEKLANALPRWSELQSFLRERESLSVPTTFPSDGRQRFADINKELSRLAAEEKKQSRQIDDDERQLGTIAVEDSLLPLKPEIEACNRLIQSVTDARRDQPLRQEEYDRLQREVTNDLVELCPTWTIADLDAFKVSTATRAEIERLIQTRREHEQSRTKLTTQHDDLSARLDQNAEDTAALDEVRDVSALSEVLDDAAEYLDNAKSLKKLQVERLKLESTVSARALKLTPPMPAGLNEPQRLPVPCKEVVAAFQTEFTELQQRLRAARQSCREEQEHLEQLEETLVASASARDSVPTREELAAGRDRRDAGWQLIRTVYVHGQSRPADVDEWLEQSERSAIDLPKEYEAVVAATDDLADKRFENAEAVAKRDQLHEQIHQARAAVVKKQAEVGSLLDEQHQWELRWQTEWQPCGFIPLAPDVMLRWLDDHAALRQSVEQHEQLAIEVDSLKASLAAFETQLRTVSGQPDGDPLSLLNKAKSVVKASQEQASDRQKLEKDRRQLDKKLVETNAKLATMASDVSEWTESWQALLNQLRLPTTWETELASRVIERLLATRSKRESLPNLEARIGAMTDRLAEFDRRVEKLCDHIGDELRQHDAEVAVRILSERLAATTLAFERRSSLQLKLASARSKLEDVRQDIQAAHASRLALLNSAESGSDAEFDAISHRADRIAVLESEITRLTREIERDRGHEDRKEFEARLSQCDLGLIQGELRDLAATLQIQEAASSAAEGKCGECRHQLKSLDGSAVAAECQQKLARQQAKLASEVHRFVPILFARHLLQEAIRRFERENQPELVGSISRLFATMTAGRYLEIERPSGERHAIIIRRQDGAERTPEQLSTGTRELLYLAIRLGYVLHYCRQTEPLPIVMDDVLVNFDDARARSTLQALREVSQQVQILFFTCHPHFVALAQEVFPGLQPLSLSATPA